MFTRLISMLVLSVSLSQGAEFRINSLFSDHMVLQRDREIRVFGTGVDGVEVKVRLGDCEGSTVARDGEWTITLPARPAGGPYTMEIIGPENIVFSDILIGDVWIGSGQSNMHMRLKFLPEYKKDSTAFGNPQVRLFKVAVAPSASPVKEAPRDKELSQGWAVADSASSGLVSAVGYYFCNDLQRELKVPIGFIHVAQGATPVEAWMDEASVKKVLPEAGLLDTLSNPKNPWVFYNGMIAPLQKFPVKGVIWYQGESGTHNPAPYEALFSALIKRWREQWGQGDFPFYFVQLASFQHTVDKSEEAWAWVREAQARALVEPKTGMAVALDLGEYGDIHPLQKKEVAGRLVKVALKGEGCDLVAEGPRFKAVEFEDGRAQVHFDHTFGGLETREVVMNRKPKLEPGTDPEAFRIPSSELAGFQVAGPDGRFVEAVAAIAGDTVIVQSPEVPTPTAVRYAWKNFALANLYNKAGFPAEPFRTDELPLPDLIVKQAEAAKKAFARAKTSANDQDPR